MAVEKWSDNVTIVHLSDDPQFTEDVLGLEQVPPKSDIILDFGSVGFLNSSNIARLLGLRKRLANAGSRLVFCNVQSQVWSVFLVTGLDKLFACTDSVATALATLQMKSEAQQR